MALVAREGHTLVEVYVDNDRGASTRSRKPRPGYLRLIADARAGKFEAVVAYTTGRITRRPREHEDLIELAERHGIAFRFVASPSFDLNTSAGRRIARILAANDAGEAEDIAERVQREALQKAEQGRFHGGPRMFGVAAGGVSLVDDEAAIVREMYETILAGGSISGVRKALNRRGVLTAAGRPWHDSSIRVILLNPRNAGIRELRGAQYPAPNPPIVPDETFRAVRALLTDPGRRTNTGRTARRWLGAGLYRCERCQRPLRTSYDGTAAHNWRVYVCGTRDGGCGRSWKAEPIDEWIADLVDARLAREDLADLLVREDGASDVDALRQEALGIRARIGQLRDLLAEPDEDVDELRAALRKAKARLGEVESGLAEAGRMGPLAALALADDPAQAWRDIPDEDVVRRQAVIRGLMTVTLAAPLRGRTRWDAEKFIRIEWR